MTNKTKIQQNQNLMIIGGIAGIAVIAVIIFILLSSNNTASLDEDIYADIPQSRADDGAFILGNPEASIKVIEFADFACPACQQYKPDVNRLIEEYVATGQVQLEWRTLPTAGGEVTAYAGTLVECAAELEPGSFWRAHEVMYDLAIARNYTMEVARPFAERMGLEPGALISCSRTADQVEIDGRYARSLGVSSTPSILISINGAPAQSVPDRRFEALSQIIESVQQ